MSTAAFWTIVCGLGAGLAASCLLLACLRPAPLDLVAALARLDSATDRNNSPRSAGGWLDPIVARSSRCGNRWLGIPLGDLDLLDRTPTRYVASRIVWALGGVGLIACAWVTALVMGIDVPAPVGLPAAAVAAGAGALVPRLSVEEDAAHAREEFRRAVAVYLTLVAQERATGRAPSQALADAAGIADNWVFVRIRTALASARRTGITPWEALARLSAQVGVAELADLADIIATAADGAAVYTTLTARARALRASAITDERARANKRSEQLTIPGTLLLVGWLIVLLYPTAIRLFMT